MTGMTISNLDRDGEVRKFAGHGEAVVTSAGGMALMRARFEPGWKWSVDLKPLAGTASCQSRHMGYVIDGRMAIRMDDGTELELNPGDIFDLEPGHDAWVLGKKACVMVDFSADVTKYALGGAAVTTSTAIDTNLEVVRRGYAAFNAGDIPGLTKLLSRDVMQHVPGDSPLAGQYKGIDAVLAYYRKLGELTDGTFRCNLVEVHGDAQGHVMALHQATAVRNGNTRISRGSILFTLLDGKVTDLLELHADLPGDDAFFA